MKILITTDAYDSMINGVAVSIHNLFTALKDFGNEVRILTLSKNHQSYKNDDVYYIRSLSLKIYPDARATFSFHDPLLDDILKWQPDIIHSQCEFFTFVFAHRLAKLLHIPIVHTYHTLYEYYTHYFCPNKALGKLRCIEIFESDNLLKVMQQNALQTASGFSKETFAYHALKLYQNMIIEKEERKKCTRFACFPKHI